MLWLPPCLPRVLCLLLCVWLLLAAPGCGRRRRPPCPSRKCRCRWKQRQTWLDCTTKRVTGTLPTFTPVDVTYDRVILEGRNLTEIPEDAFSGLRMRGLNLAGNWFYSGLEATAFRSGGEMLELLVLSDCSLPELPVNSLQWTPGLRSLYVDGNRLTGLSSTSFHSTPHLTLIVLSRNQLHSVHPKAFRGLNALEQLHLMDNLLTELPRKLFRGLDVLQGLDLSYNRIARITSANFRYASQLQWLDVSHNSISQLGRNAFRGLRRLRSLRLDANPLVTLDSAFVAMSGLRHLSLDISNVSELSAQTFSGLRRLENLNVGEIGRPGLPAGLLSPLSKLEFLSVFNHSGQLQALALDLFSPDYSLKRLHLSLVPLNPCHCNVQWINKLVARGAYISGYCGDRRPRSCLRRKHASSLRSWFGGKP